MRPIVRPALLLIVAGGSAFAEIDDSGAVRLEYGYLCTPVATATHGAEDTASGIIQEFDEHPGINFHGSEIPAALGVSFGAKVQPKPEFAGPVTIVVTHPPLGANGMTQESWSAELPADQYLYVGYGLSESWELVTGDWTLSALSRDRVVFQIDFQLVDPAHIKEGSPLCSAQSGNS